MPHLVFAFLRLLFLPWSIGVHLHHPHASAGVGEEFYDGIKFNFTTLWRSAKSSSNCTHAPTRPALPFELQTPAEIVNCSWRALCTTRAASRFRQRGSRVCSMRKNEATTRVAKINNLSFVVLAARRLARSCTARWLLVCAFPIHEFSTMLPHAALLLHTKHSRNVFHRTTVGRVVRRKRVGGSDFFMWRCNVLEVVNASNVQQLENAVNCAWEF